MLAAIFAVGAIIISRLNYAVDVTTQEQQVNDPDRVQDLRTQVLNRYQGLESQSTDIQSLKTRRAELVEGLGDRTTWPLDIADEWEQMGAQILQLETAFSQACSQFKAFLNDPARNISVPDNLPRECPALS